MKKAFYLVSAIYLSIAILVPAVANAQFVPPDSVTNYQTTVTSSGGACSTFTTQGLSGVFNCLTGIMNQIVVLLIAGAVVYIVYGAFTMIRSEEKRESGREMVVYGIIGLFVMISVWGLVNILDRTFNLRGNYIPAPQITPQ